MNEKGWQKRKNKGVKLGRVSEEWPGKKQYEKGRKTREWAQKNRTDQQ